MPVTKTTISVTGDREMLSVNMVEHSGLVLLHQIIINTSCWKRPVRRSALNNHHSVTYPATVPANLATRGLNIPDSAADDLFRSQYDDETLFYDAVRLDDRIRLFCPSLGNFDDLLSRTQITVNGETVRFRKRLVRPRYCEVDLRGAQGGELKLTVDDWTWEGEVSPLETDLFANTNATILFNKNNQIQWIVDQIRFHQEHHGLNAVVIVDNGSDAYPSEDLATSLAPLNLAAFRVLSIPAKWGSAGPKGYRNRSLFFQSAILNLVRTRFLRRARAVLICDIDEIVLPRADGISVFDVAVKRWHGWLPFEGGSLFPQADEGKTVKYSDHIMRNTAAEKPTKKYCVAMGRIIGRFGWEVHKPDVVSFDYLMDRSQFRLGHCQGIKNGWKPAKKPKSDRLAVDSEAVDAFKVIENSI